MLNATQQDVSLGLVHMLNGTQQDVSLGLVHMLNATQQDVSLGLVHIEWYATGCFSRTCTHVECYATGCFSRTCTHVEWYATGCFSRTCTPAFKARLTLGLSLICKSYFTAPNASNLLTGCSSESTYFMTSYMMSARGGRRVSPQCKCHDLAST